ncbi:MAG: MotA/TolQ/ExbB proton channel family protein [Myxococcota bacterium]
MGAFARFFVEGGVWMLPIAFVSVLALAVSVERLYVLLVLYNGDGAKLYEGIAEAVRKGQTRQAMELCEEVSKTPLAQVMERALSRAGEGEEAVQGALDEVTQEVTPAIQRRTGALGVLASLATLLGLLGTVMGLIEAFRVVAEAPPDQKSVLLTKAIAVAMNTTAFGLMVAIPLMFVSLILNGATKKILDEIEVYSLKIEHLLAAQGRKG